MAPDKRKALQPVLDSIEKGWQIVKPSPLTPDNLETECIFQHRAAGHEQVRIVIDNSLFRLSNLSELQDLIRSVIKPGPKHLLSETVARFLGRTSELGPRRAHLVVGAC